jgi:hypothetical protein
MAVLITVFKSELDKYDTLTDQLKLLSEQVNDIANAIVFVPRSGVLMQFIKVLGAYPIQYGIHSDNEI